MTPAATNAELAAPANPTGQPLASTMQAGETIGAPQAIEVQQVRRAAAPAGATATGTGTGTDIVAYALNTRNPVGQKQYSRGFGSAAKAARNCARYAAPDIAQRAFLEAGGPQRDRYGMDPDGDGFACGWSPEPFRKAVRG